MSVNKHIQALCSDRGLGSYHQEILQYLWDNRNKSRLITLSIVHVSSSGMSRDIKGGFVHKGAFVDITRLIGNITESKISKKTDGVKIGGCGMDMGFALLDNFYGALIPSNSKVMPYQLKAVQYYQLF